MSGDQMTWESTISLAKNTLRATDQPMTYTHFLRLFRRDFSLDFEPEALRAGFASGVEALSSDSAITVKRNGDNDENVIVCCWSRRTLEQLQKKPVMIDLGRRTPYGSYRF